MMNMNEGPCSKKREATTPKNEQHATTTNLLVRLPVLAAVAVRKKSSKHWSLFTKLLFSVTVNLFIC